MVWKGSRAGVCSRIGVSSGEMEMEASCSMGGVGTAVGGEAAQKIPVGGVGRREGMAGEGVCR